MKIFKNTDLATLDHPFSLSGLPKMTIRVSPHTKRGVRVAGKGGAKVLPPPFDKEAGIPGIAIHHKFVVVDFDAGAAPLPVGGSPTGAGESPALPIFQTGSKIMKI